MVYELEPRKPKIPRIPAHWFHLKPNMTLLFWKEVKRRVSKKHVRLKDYTTINQIIKEILHEDFKEYYVRRVRTTHTNQE